MYFNICKFNTISSTSTYASQNAENIPTPALIIADEQTGGRGRQGKSFYSPHGTGLYFTLLIKTETVPENITPAAAVAVCRAIEDLTDKKPSIKWVNDIFADSRKVCGILTENFVRNGQRYISIGIGINLTTTDFPDGLNAGSIGEVNKDALASEIAEYILNYFEFPCRFDIHGEYDKRLFLKGKKIEFIRNGEKQTAVVIGTDEKCRLITINSDGETEKLSSGEISICL